jgi:hypothetical protein
MAPPAYTITAADVGKHCIQAFGRLWPTAFLGGPITERDVGRLVYYSAYGDFLYAGAAERRTAEPERVAGLTAG